MPNSTPWELLSLSRLLPDPMRGEQRSFGPMETLSHSFKDHAIGDLNVHHSYDDQTRMGMISVITMADEE